MLDSWFRESHNKQSDGGVKSFQDIRVVVAAFLCVSCVQGQELYVVLGECASVRRSSMLGRAVTAVWCCLVDGT
ncbi:hypothetical protein Pmani_013215 [Petrolisthes manimaculis]|uniref:Uncharacterized protein n=1 Tax=Petrolisthes manimaculis TaxID=1843537 RepID=A0AAE1PXQ4_9EUCA|nr:hypothetical protein Pmani_013215 [Petrolisthes manimaculis]